ncbi:MAG: hypothetical protein ACFB6R_12545 [Alphaproteobacteria bacterium]
MSSLSGLTADTPAPNNRPGSSGHAAAAFAGWVARTPRAEALFCTSASSASHSVSYAALARWTAVIRSALPAPTDAAGRVPGPIAVCAAPGAERIAALLAVFLDARPVMPLDPASGEAAVSAQITATRPDAVLVHGVSSGALDILERSGVPAIPIPGAGRPAHDRVRPGAVRRALYARI